VAWLTIGLIIALQLAWTYLPFMQFIFGSEALSLTVWGSFWREVLAFS